MAEKLTDEQLAALLDGSIEDLEDLPSWAPWPSGAYSIFTEKGFVPKTVNDKLAFELKMKLVEMLELVNPATPEADIPKVDDETGLLFMMDNEIGRGFFKEAISPFMAITGSKDRRVNVEASAGMNLMVVLKKTVKDDKAFNNLVRLEIL